MVRYQRTKIRKNIIVVSQYKRKRIGKRTFLRNVNNSYYYVQYNNKRYKVVTYKGNNYIYL